MENWVQHAICPLDLPTGEFSDFLNDGVPITFASLKDAQDNSAGARGVEVFTDLHADYYALIFYACKC
jgi:hypothetical protein